MEDTITPDDILDCRGASCPIPILQTKKAMAIIESILLFIMTPYWYIESLRKINLQPCPKTLTYVVLSISPIQQNPRTISVRHFFLALSRFRSP